MKRFMIRSRKLISMVVLVAFLFRSGVPAYAESPVKMKNFRGTVDILADGPVPFALEGTASHLGNFQAQGEVEFGPGEEPGSLLGEGVVVFHAANGDLLVGVVTWDVDPTVDGLAQATIHFKWSDSVEFSDGTIVSNTGHFVECRPPGLVVIAIISVLIALLLPAIQSAR
jgi:hypothetical protein